VVLVAPVLAAGRGKMQVKNAVFYVAAQISGGMAASLVYNAVTSGAKFGLGPYGAFTWSGVVVAEFVFTFLLCFVVLSTATVKVPSHGRTEFAMLLTKALCCSKL
jgi:glycerol uptake facilitator-like aquaporin